MTARMNRRLYGFFAKRLDEAGLELVPDGRDDRGKRWDLGALLRTVLGAMLTGARSLADVEEMTERMSSPMKRLFGIQRRVPDTTLRDALCTIGPVIDVFPIPAPTNEMGVFEAALRALSQEYSGLFQLVCYDAGACSAHNAKLVRELGYHYLFVLTSAQPTLFEEAKLWLGTRQANEADATSEDIQRGQIIVRRLYFGAATAAPDGWESLRSVLRVETEIRDKNGKLISHDNHYLISSLPEYRLTKEHWLLVVRRRWGVETSHQILDTVFAEDDHPWIEAQPRAALVVAILRRISYTLLSLFRSVTQRSQERRTIPWKRLMRDVLFALVTTTRQQLDGLRRHNIATLC